MIFSPAFLTELKERASLVDVIGKRLKLIRAGREYKALCPFHNENTPSFTVIPEKGFYHCFGCQAHGDAIKFVQEYEGISFTEAVSKIADEVGLPIPAARPDEDRRQQENQDLYDICEAACQWFEAQLWGEAGQQARAYLRERGLNKSTCTSYRLGYALDSWEGLKAHLVGKGYAAPLLIKAGLLIASERGGYDRFRGRLIFPIVNKSGRVIAFGGRALTKEQEPKYLNSPETPLFHKGHVLYGLPQLAHKRREQKPMLLVEGYMDAIAVDQSQVAGAVAPLGTAVTEDQIKLLWQYAQEPVVCFDGDQAGQRAALKLIERVLPILKPGHSLSFLTLPKGEDPDSLLRSQGPVALTQALATALPLVEALWLFLRPAQEVPSPDAKAQALQAFRELTNTIANTDIRSFYWQDLKERVYALGRTQSRQAYGKGAGKGPLKGQVRGLALTSHPPATALRKSLELGLLATLVNYPELAEELAEPLALISFDDEGLDRVRQDLVSAIYAEGLLDSISIEPSSLRTILIEKGYLAFVESLQQQTVYMLSPFARQGQDIDQVRTAWQASFDAYCQRHTTASTAQPPDADIFSEQGWQRFTEQKKQELDADQFPEN